MPDSTPHLSLCMIVKNESSQLAQCLSAACEHVDEIVIVDTGSQDNTAEIAAGFTDRLEHFEWCDDFAAARNHGLCKARGDWIVVLDADEVIEPEGWRAIRGAIESTGMDGFYLTQRNYSQRNSETQALGRDWVPVAEPTPYTRDYRGFRANPILRVFRNRQDIEYRGRVHEVVDRSVQPERREHLDVAIHHYMDQNPARPVADRQREYLRLIEQATNEGTDGRLHTAAGSIRLHYLEDFPGAIAHFEQAVALGYRAQENRESIAEAHYRMGDLDAAFASYRDLYETGHRSFNLCNNLANLAVRRNLRPLAVRLLQQALAYEGLEESVRRRVEHNLRYLRDTSEGQ